MKPIEKYEKHYLWYSGTTPSNNRWHKRALGRLRRRKARQELSFMDRGVEQR